jgi:hypothetical protein
VQVLHDQHQRPSHAQPLDHAQQELEQPPLTGTRHRRAHGRPVAAPGKVGHQAAQFGTGGTGDRFQLVRVEGAGQPAQRLGDRRERHALLAEGHAAAAQHQHAPLRGDGGHLVGQPGLADPRLPTDQRHQRLPAGGVGQQSRSRASSSARPTKRPVMTWYAMPPSTPAPAPDEGRPGWSAGHPARVAASCEAAQRATMSRSGLQPVAGAEELRSWTARRCRWRSLPAAQRRS